MRDTNLSLRWGIGLRFLSASAEPEGASEMVSFKNTILDPRMGVESLDHSPR